MINQIGPIFMSDALFLAEFFDREPLETVMKFRKN